MRMADVGGMSYLLALHVPPMKVGGNLQLPTPVKQMDTREPQHCLTLAYGVMPGE